MILQYEHNLLNKKDNTSLHRKNNGSFVYKLKQPSVSICVFQTEEIFYHEDHEVHEEGLVISGDYSFLPGSLHGLRVLRGPRVPKLYPLTGFFNEKTKEP